MSIRSLYCTHTIRIGLSNDIDARIDAFTLSEIDLALAPIDDFDVESDLSLNVNVMDTMRFPDDLERWRFHNKRSDAPKTDHWRRQRAAGRG